MFSKIIFYSFCFLLLVGFRIFPGDAHWSTSTASPKIWISFCERPTMTDNNLDGSDPLGGQTVTFDTITQSIFNDYNNIASSYINLADAATDPAYDANLAATRTVRVCFGNLSAGLSGYAQQTRSGLDITACTITLSPSTKSSVKSFTSTLTHELGHCLGLDHPQDTVHSIMSYFRSPNVVRLQVDDKMGITFLYPTNSDQAKESSNLGFSCSPRN